MLTAYAMYNGLLSRCGAIKYHKGHRLLIKFVIYDVKQKQCTV